MASGATKNGSLGRSNFRCETMRCQEIGRPLEPDLPLLPHLLSCAHEDDLTHREVPQTTEVAGVGRFEPETLAAHTVNGSRRRHGLAGVQVVHVIARRRRKARIGGRHVPARSVIKRFALGVPGAETVDRLDGRLEMGRERDVLRKRSEVVALRQHARRDQRWRQQGLSLPRRGRALRTRDRSTGTTGAPSHRAPPGPVQESARRGARRAGNRRTSRRRDC